MLKNLSIFIFTWNHQALRISAPSIECVLPYKLYDPDFYPAIKSILQRYKPDIIAFGSQEDPTPGSYFHSHFLPEFLAELEYNLLKRTKMMGVGIETYKSLKSLEFKLRGLRLSIYTKNTIYGSIQLEERHLIADQSWINCSYPFLQSKGAVVLYLKIPDYGYIAFICAHLPFDANNLKDAYKQQSYELRNQSLKISNDSFNYILDNLIYKNPMHQPVDHIFFFGDLNYRVFSPETQPFHNSSLNISQLQRIYIKYDELYHSLTQNEIKLLFKEGICGQGPSFLPTCKMHKPRDVSSSTTINEKYISDLYNTGSLNQRQPSWCDRILYYTFSDKINIRCVTYDRLDQGETMKHSDHAAVYGLFVLTKE